MILEQDVYHSETGFSAPKSFGNDRPYSKDLRMPLSKTNA